MKSNSQCGIKIFISIFLLFQGVLFSQITDSTLNEIFNNWGNFNHVNNFRFSVTFNKTKKDTVYQMSVKFSFPKLSFLEKFSSPDTNISINKTFNMNVKDTIWNQLFASKVFGAINSLNDSSSSHSNCLNPFMKLVLYYKDISYKKCILNESELSNDDTGFILSIFDNLSDLKLYKMPDIKLFEKPITHMNKRLINH